MFVAVIWGFSCAVHASGGAPGEPDEDAWTTDTAAAVDNAAAQDKDLLLLFTGSDWCPPCIKLEEQILGKEEFLDSARKNFVLVKFDFPEKTQLLPELERQNEEWSDRFGIEGFPTIVLIDQDERPYAFTGFRDEGPVEFVAHLDELRSARETRDAALEKAAAATGLERAGFLDEALSALDSTIVQIYYTELIEEIGTLDPDDEAGLRTKYFAQRDREMRQALMSNIAMVARLRQPDDAIAFIDATLSENRLPLDMWLTAQGTKLRLLRGLDRIDDANSLVDEMIETADIDPETRQRLVNNKAYYLASLDRHDEAFAELARRTRSFPDNLLMTIAVGDLHDSLGQFDKAIETYDRAMIAAASRPELLLEVAQARADVLIELDRIDEALSALDRLVEDAGLPGPVRAAASLHKAMVLRETGRRRAAILAENKAIELIETTDEKAEIQNLVDQLRDRYERPNGG